MSLHTLYNDALAGSDWTELPPEEDKRAMLLFGRRDSEVAFNNNINWRGGGGASSLTV